MTNDKTRNAKLELGNWKLELGNWKQETQITNDLMTNAPMTNGLIT
jgi:hypothetical protein